MIRTSCSRRLCKSLKLPSGKCSGGHPPTATPIHRNGPPAWPPTALSISSFQSPKRPSGKDASDTHPYRAASRRAGLPARTPVPPRLQCPVVEPAFRQGLWCPPPSANPSRRNGPRHCLWMPRPSGSRQSPKRPSAGGRQLPCPSAIAQSPKRHFSSGAGAPPSPDPNRRIVPPPEAALYRARRL
jgi:hypothetical protein